MVTLQLPRRAKRTPSFGDALKKAGRALDALKRGTRPVSSHLVENGYTLAAGASFTTAGFIHSVFTGFIVMGVSLLAIEFKVRD